MPEQEWESLDMTNTQIAPVILIRLDEKVMQILDTQGRILARLDLASEQMSLVIGKSAPDTSVTSGMRTLITMVVSVCLATLAATITLIIVVLTHIVGTR
jgi:hypothetical protein